MQWAGAGQCAGFSFYRLSRCWVAAMPVARGPALPREVTLQNFHLSGDNFLGASFLWRTDLQAIAGSYDESTFGGEDYDMWLRMHLIRLSATAAIRTVELKC
jgi:hypothetical protein